MGIPDHLTCLLRNLYAGQEATIRTGHGTMDRFHIGKGVCQGCISSPCIFNFHAEYIIRNTRLDEAQAGIKIAGRNINNLRYADDTTFMAESKEELKSLLMKVKEVSAKSWLKTQHSKYKNHGIWSHHFMADRWGNSGNSVRLNFLRLPFVLESMIGRILSLCLFNLHAEYIMQNAGLDDAQTVIKIARRHINNFIHADNTTFMAESKEELKSLLMKS